MEESKELQGFYKIFRAVIYVSILMEFFAYALEPEQLDFLGGVVTDIHTRIKRWMIYHDGNLVYSLSLIHIYMPDKNDPKYKKRYEKEVAAGRKFAKTARIAVSYTHLGDREQEPAHADSQCLCGGSPCLAAAT